MALLKAAVVIASRFEPAIQRTYEEWSQHYATTILPARPGKPRDKAKVEGGVLIAERWILGRLRNVTCFSIAELNELIAGLLVDESSKCCATCLVVETFDVIDGCRVREPEDHVKRRAKRTLGRLHDQECKPYRAVETFDVWRESHRLLRHTAHLNVLL